MANFTDDTTNDLIELLNEKRETLRSDRFNITGAADSADKERTKKDIARIKTELRHRELNA